MRYKKVEIRSPNTCYQNLVAGPDQCFLSLVCTECPEVRQIDVEQPVVSLLWQTKATLLICDENTQTSPLPSLRQRTRHFIPASQLLSLTEFGRCAACRSGNLGAPCIMPFCACLKHLPVQCSVPAESTWTLMS